MVGLLHVQDRESQPKPSFTTGIQGGGHIPNITCKNENHITKTSVYPTPRIAIVTNEGLGWDSRT